MRGCNDLHKNQGRNGLDNGWIQFHNVRVPRENMLMRWAQVWLIYVAFIYVLCRCLPMVSTRSHPKLSSVMELLLEVEFQWFRILQVTAKEYIITPLDYAKKALTIAIRYSAVRRQFLGKSYRSEFICRFNWKTRTTDFRLSITSIQTHAITSNLLCIPFYSSASYKEI